MSATVRDESGPVSVSRAMSVAVWDESGPVSVSRAVCYSQG